MFAAISGGLTFAGADLSELRLEDNSECFSAIFDFISSPESLEGVLCRIWFCPKSSYFGFCEEKAGVTRESVFSMIFDSSKLYPLYMLS